MLSGTVEESQFIGVRVAVADRSAAPRPRCPNLEKAEAQVGSALASSPYWEISRGVCVVIEDHTLVVRGTVRSFYLRQQAESTSRRHSGNSPVRYEVSVPEYPPPTA